MLANLVFLFLCLLFGATSAPVSELNSPVDVFSRAVGDQCKATEGAGTCQNKSQCQGISYPANLCPKDPADVQCCVVISCRSDAGSGYCRSVSNNRCAGGTFASGLCPGSDDIKCCIKKTTNNPSPAASPTPTPAPGRTPAPSTWPDCRKTLSCSFAAIEKTTMQERLDFVRYMQSTFFGPSFNAASQFRAIEGVITFFINHNLGEPGSWVSYVDAGIVEAIQRGGALALGLSAETGGNPGSAKWQNFLQQFKAGRLGDRDVHDFTWSDSEQTATEYGRSLADGRKLPATGQILRWYKFTQLFRWIMRNRQATIEIAKNAAPLGTGWIVGKCAEAAINWLTDITDIKPTICGSAAAYDLSELDGVPVSNTGILKDTGILLKMIAKLLVCLNFS